jgi:uncharacterized protein YabN with tetrapyrrole methylase and pyrophosphatase domain
LIAPDERRLGEISLLDGLPEGSCALERAQLAAELAASVGFDWPDRNGVLAKIHEELSELHVALASREQGAVLAEYGDLLLAVTNLSRFLDADIRAEDALWAANRRFETRFRALERLLSTRGIAFADASADLLDALWREVKAEQLRLESPSEPRGPSGP